MSNRGSKLIFLVSQPRAGSTLTQKILAGHPQIHTTAEPWLMLAPLCPATEAPYDVVWAKKGQDQFLAHLPNDAYDEGLRRMYGYLYDEALMRAGKAFFLDKTPRYYFILPELAKTFPEAKFIILLRNPLAVLCSIVSTWVGKDWFALGAYRQDLLVAPHLLLAGITQLQERCLTLCYEQLLAEPEAKLNQICQFLNIAYDPALLEYQTSTPWTLGDTKSVDRKNKPDPVHAHQWQSDLRDPQTWRVCQEYLTYLGPKTVGAMGYNPETLAQILQKQRPTPWDLTFSLQTLLQPAQSRSAAAHLGIRLYRRMRRS